MSNVDNHAFLSPSTSDRWLNCTPSARLEALEPKQATSTYASEGIEAHTLAELKLSYLLSKTSDKIYNLNLESFIKNSKYYNEEFNEFVDKFCDEVMTIINEDYKGQCVKVVLEDIVKFEDVVPDGSGTSDVVIIGPDFIHIIDLKFGKGVPVSAINNSQLRLYALGALRKYRLEGMFREVKMTICQPRLYDNSTDFMSVLDLYYWASNFVKPRAELAIQGKGELVSGDHCKFCRRKGKCEVLGEKQLEIARQEFELAIVDNNVLEPKNMSPDMLSRILQIAPKFIAWFKDVQTYATAAMINEGIEIPGYKVVEGRSIRVITNPDAIVETLKTSGFSEEDYLEPTKILGITALEKNVGKKLFNELCKDYIIKPTGRPTIALETDRRVALDVKQFKLSGQEFEDDYDVE